MDSKAGILGPLFAPLPTPVLDVLEALSLTTPLNFALLLVTIYIILSFIPSTPILPLDPPTAPTSYNWRPEKHPEAILWRSWTPEELRGYDGTSGGKEGGRILFAIRRKVYDVTSGKSFYGPGGPYETFAGRDASRGLSKQSFEADMLTPVDEPIDELKDLTASDWTNLKDWESHFQNKYIMCGDYVQP